MGIPNVAAKRTIAGGSLNQAEDTGLVRAASRNPSFQAVYDKILKAARFYSLPVTCAWLAEVDPENWALA